MFKKLANSIMENIKKTTEDFIKNASLSNDIQNYVWDVISKMDDHSDFYSWSRGYWVQYDTLGKVIPLLDRKAYMKKGQSFKKGQVYKVGPTFQSEMSIGASIGDIGRVYTLEVLEYPAQYAVAKDKDSVMLFNWKE